MDRGVPVGEGSRLVGVCMHVPCVLWSRSVFVMCLCCPQVWLVWPVSISSVALPPCRNLVLIKFTQETLTKECKSLSNISGVYCFIPLSICSVCILKRRTDLKRGDLSVISNPLHQRCFSTSFSYLPPNSPVRSLPLSPSCHLCLFLAPLDSI